jgi:hypothetical protein
VHKWRYIRNHSSAFFVCVFVEFVHFSLKVTDGVADSVGYVGFYRAKGFVYLVGGTFLFRVIEALYNGKVNPFPLRGFLQKIRHKDTS